MIKPYIKNETAVDIICSICDRMCPGMDCEPADCEWMKMLAEKAVDAVPVVRCKDCSWHKSVDDDGDDFEVCNYYNREVMGYQFCSEAEPCKTTDESVGLDEEDDNG